jgi:hypothetical protein
MAARKCWKLEHNLAVLTLFLAAGVPGRAADWVALEVRDGKGEYVLRTEHPDDTYFLILGSLSPEAGPHPVTVETAAAAGPASLPKARPAGDPAWRRRVAALAEQLARARRERQPAAPYAPLPSPAREKVFHLFAGDHDFHNRGSYADVRAELRGVGRHCQAYVDRATPDDDDVRATVADAVRTFDDAVYPRARDLLGEALDVDRDGRFTIFLTGRLAHMQAGKVSLGGFVRGADFYRDLEAPFGNRCDMLYLNADLRPGPYLRTLLAHEYTHAVVFSQHVFGRYPGGAAGRDEESWLNEGLAHLMEDEHGFGWDNLDYRVSAFLNAPERYRLVVADYYGSGLWRSPGTRGMAYLFLRWCADLAGQDLARKLAQSGLRGVDNLEVATREPFENLFRRWSAALLVAGTGLDVGGLPLLRRPDLRRPLGTRRLYGPRFAEVSLHGGTHRVALGGTGLCYVLLHSPGGPCSRITVAADPKAHLQVTLLRLPPDYPRLSVHWQLLGAGRCGTLQLTAHGGGVTVDDIIWERVLPEGKPGDTDYRADAEARRTVARWLDTPHIARGQTRTSRRIAMPPGEGGRGPWVIKVIGTDGVGRRVAGWALVSAEGSPHSP